MQDAVADEAGGELGNVDADPLAAQRFGRVHGGAAAAEGVEHGVAFVGRRFNDAIHQGERFLRRVAEAFTVCSSQIRNICPNIVEFPSRLFIKVSFESWYVPWLSLDNPTSINEFLHIFSCIAPSSSDSENLIMTI